VGRQGAHRVSNFFQYDDLRESEMATKPKPKPEPEPEPEPDDPTDRNPGGTAPEPRLLTPADLMKALEERLDALFTSQTALIERVEKLEERADAPPIRLGKRP
jgi:hypothetical protein